MTTVIHYLQAKTYNGVKSVLLLLVKLVNLEARERLAKIIRQVRGNQSLRAFGRVCGVSQTPVKAWEEKQSVPDTENLKRIALLAGFNSMDDLLVYLEGKSTPVQNPEELDQIINKIRQMSVDQVIKVNNAVIERLVDASQN